MSKSTERAILAGGCFWGMQDLFRRQAGVLSTRVGYTGGDVPNATYRNHGTHAEAIEIVFDPQRVSYRRLLEFFFQIHDPTTLNRQGNDRGASYRSAIFYTSDEQRRIANDTIADVNASGLWPGTVVTQVAPAGPFWEAEAEHQDYLERYPNGYTCHFIRPDWKLPTRAEVQRARLKVSHRLLAGRCGRTAAENGAVSVIGHARTMSIDQVSRILRLSHVGTVHLVDRLVEPNLVEKRPSALDRRRMSLALTNGRLAATGQPTRTSACRIDGSAQSGGARGFGRIRTRRRTVAAASVPLYRDSTLRSIPRSRGYPTAQAVSEDGR
jgi:peptide-methionine (S)-S-oxide reductase